MKSGGGLVASAALILIATLTSGCTVGAGHGSLTSGDDPTAPDEQCLTSEVSDVRGVGDTFHVEDGGHPITIEDVALVSASGVDLIEARARAVTSEGLGAFYPDDSDLWNRMEKAEGAVFRPGDMVNIAVVVKKDADIGEFPAIAVTYTENGVSYVAENAMIVTIKDFCF